MAEREHEGMDITQNVETWQGFVRLVTWATGASVVILALMAIFLV